jgi:hypothetical protein
MTQLYIEMLNPLTLFLYFLLVYFGAVDRYIFPVENVLSVIGFQYVDILISNAAVHGWGRSKLFYIICCTEGHKQQAVSRSAHLQVNLPIPIRSFFSVFVR